MTDHTKASADQKDPSPLTAEQRRLVRQAVEDGIREGRMVEIHPIALAALLAALEEQEQTSAWCATHLRRTAAERASLREKLAAADGRTEDLVDALPRCQARQGCTRPRTRLVMAGDGSYAGCDECVPASHETKDLPHAAAVRAAKVGGAR